MSGWLSDMLGLDNDSYRQAEREARRRLEAYAQEVEWEWHSPEVVRTRRRIRARWRLEGWKNNKKVVSMGRR